MILSLLGELDYDAVKAILRVPDVETFEEADEDVDCYVCSPGGDTFVYTAFVDALAAHRKADRLLTTAMGEVCSGAPVLVAAGSPGRRYSYRHTLWGMHEPFHCGEHDGPASQRVDERMIQSVRDRFYNLLFELTGTKPGVWRRRLKDREMLYFDAKDALKFKLIDEVL